MLDNTLIIYTTDNGGESLLQGILIAVHSCVLRLDFAACQLNPTFGFLVYLQAPLFRRLGLLTMLLVRLTFSSRFFSQ